MMNIDLKFLKKKNKLKKGGSGIKPDFYWRCIVVVALVIMIAFCVFDFLLFQSTSKGPSLLTTDTDMQGTVKKERIDKVLEYFKEREDKSTQILNSPSPVVDPSL